MRLARRAGVTLVELVVALTLFGLVATIMLNVVRGQQRFHVGSLGIIDTKRSVHQAIELLYGELRSVSPPDIYAISDSSVSFRTTVGTSHICSVDSARSYITFPATHTIRAAALSTFLATPRAGDSVLVFDSGDGAGPDDDRWQLHVVLADPGAGPCPRRPFGLASGATEAAGIGVTIAPSLGPSVVVGSPVRFFRPASYSLYRGTGSTWMLGYSLCAAGACTGRQPLSGPYLPFARGGAGGVAFEFYDRDGARTTDPSRVARIGVVARARSASTLDVGHVRGQRYQDSLAVTVALRNHP
jgi:prepilin-type N-terminal cleavage/methylation domain-containing protein